MAERFTSKTYDAFAKSILDRFRRALPADYMPEADYLVNDAETIKKSFLKHGYKLSKNDMVKALASVSLPFTGNRYEEVWKTLVKGDGIDIKSTLSFHMISRLTEYIFRCNPFLTKGLQCTYSHVFLDEFQDTTQLQYELVKTCFKNSEVILSAVGDTKQRIMVWAGALVGVFEKFVGDFIADKNELLMNHRSAPKLVELQKLMYQSLDDIPKDIRCSSKWDPNDGEIFLYEFTDNNIEAVNIALDIKKRVESGVKLNEICILTKQTPIEYTSEIINILSKSGIRARIEVEYQDLIKEPVTLLVINSLKIAVIDKCPDSWEFINDMLWVINQSSIKSNSSFEMELRTLYRDIKRFKGDLVGCNDADLFEEVVDLILDIYGIEKLKSIYPQYNQGTYFKSLITKIKEYLWEEYLLTKGIWEVTFDNFMGLNSIPIMTIHKSKGLEFEIVYFIGLEDSAFWSFKNQPLEDKCVFFVALSRAKRTIVFTFCEWRPLKYTNEQKKSEINELYQLLESVGSIQKIVI